ncbi:MAG: NAD-dependent succinate-semialdehyde dehydrogenase [Chrysiogenia bacterium]
MALQSINPASGELLESYVEQTVDQVGASVEKADRAFGAWRQTGFAERTRLLLGAADLLRSQKRALADLMSREMGKPTLQAQAEIEKCALVCGYYAENAAAMLAPENILADAHAAYVRFDPLGAVLAVMPWNFPFWQVFRFAAPALMAGNVCLLKHAANVQGCAAAIEEIFSRAGFPEQVFTTLRIGSAQVEALVAHPLLRAVTLTGSERAGSEVAVAAGRSLKKIVLELGGSDPFIVMADAQLKPCVAAAVSSRMINNGQSCIAAKRFIVVDAIFDRFQKDFVAAVTKLKTGDPLDESNDLGPLAREDLLLELERQVAESVSRGARVLTGGGRLGPGPGFYFQPTILAGVEPGMPAYEEELFGPVAALISARDDEDALRIANDTAFGLGASVWTQDQSRGEKMAALIDAGMVFINGMVRSDPRLPFGGVKMSGFGRELSAYGIKEFVNIKTVVIS